MQHILPPLVVLSLAFAPLLAFDAEPDRGSDLEKIQGTWYRTHLTIAGRVQKEPPGDGKIVIKGTHLQFPTPEDSWTITLDSMRNPRWFDYRGNITVDDAPAKYPPNIDVVYRGIYRLEGDTLTICSVYNGSEKDRPTKFESTGGAVWLQVFKRKRP